jgi:biopolymer transport protein ExbD
MASKPSHPRAARRGPAGRGSSHGVARRRHVLDLLPLLDVFMVVLFVFATIQEQRLDETTRDAALLEARAAAADRALQAALAREHEQQLQQAADRREAAAHGETAARAEAEQLRREIERLRQAFVDEQAELHATLARAGLPEQLLERLALFERLLDEHGVLEIELRGVLDESGAVVNHCCFRTDPLSDAWRTCGAVPVLPEARERWLDEGAHGLAEALRRTKGGRATTLVRQDHWASHRVAAKLADLLRTRFSDHYVDTEEEPELPLRCG